MHFPVSEPHAPQVSMVPFVSTCLDGKALCEPFGSGSVIAAWTERSRPRGEGKGDSISILNFAPNPPGGKSALALATCADISRFKCKVQHDDDFRIGEGERGRSVSHF